MQLFAFILLDSFLDTLSESMLFRNISEILVCAAASFEQVRKWLRRRKQHRMCFYSSNLKEMKREAVSKEQEKNAKQRGRTIDSYFSQSAESQSVGLSVYGKTEEEKAVSGEKTFDMCCSCQVRSFDTHHDLLFSFQSSGYDLTNIDEASYLYYTTSCLADTFRKISKRYPKQFTELFATRPYLLLLQFGDRSLAEIFGLSTPSFSRTDEDILRILQITSNIPERSLEVIPALGFIVRILQTSQKAFQQWVSTRSDTADILQRFFLFCIRLCSVLVECDNKHGQLLIGEVIGLLGAIAPERFEQKVMDTTIQPLLTDFDLARYMIKRYFVKDLKGLPDRKIHNRIAVTVQHLLRFIHIQVTKSTEKLSNDDAMNAKIEKIREDLAKQPLTDLSSLPSYLIELFSSDDLNVISQYWKTEYSSRKEALGDSSGFDKLPCKNYAKWITRFTDRLISLCILKDKEEYPQSRFSTCTLANLTLESTLKRNGSTGEIDSENAKPLEGRVIFLFRSLLSPECSDKVSYLFVHALSFALFYFYGKGEASTTESISSTTPHLEQQQQQPPSNPFFSKLADYINSILDHCNASSDNEMQHCCSDLLAGLDTLQSWAMTYEYRGKTAENVSWKSKGKILNQFLAMIDRRQIIRVAKQLGQYERAIK